jgi:hypothetical protein
MSIVEELVRQYRTDNGTVNPWFTRRLRDQPAEVQQEVRSRLAEQGETLNDWLTDEELDELAERLFDSLENGVTKSWVKIANELCAHRDPPLKKRFTARNIQPLVDRVSDIREKYKRDSAELEERPTKEWVLANLTDTEVMEHFGSRVLETILRTVQRCCDCPFNRTSYGTRGRIA